jgi:DNA-binding NarL/FixJ family response regulator
MHGTNGPAIAQADLKKLEAAMAIRVLLVDDHPVVLEGLKSVLKNEADIELVGMAGNSTDAVELVRKLNPDVVVLDVTMPKVNGIDTLRQIRAVSQDTEVVALSMHSGKQVACDMLAAGASSYILKAASLQHLITAIRTVITGETYLPPEVADLIPPEMLRPHRNHLATAGEALSEREKEVLRLVAEGKSSKEIAAQLFVTTKTIVWHRQSIMGKIGVRTIAELTKYAVRMGLTSLDG